MQQYLQPIVRCIYPKILFFSLLCFPLVTITRATHEAVEEELNPSEELKITKALDLYIKRLFQAIDDYPEQETKETIEEYQKKLGEKTEKVVQYLIEDKHFFSSHQQMGIIKMVMKMIKDKLATLLDEEDTRPILDKALDPIRQEIDLYTNLDDNILIESWDDQRVILEKLLTQQKEKQLPLTKEQKKVVNQLVTSIQEHADRYLEGLNYYYLEDQEEQYYEEALERQKYYDTITQLLRLSLKDQSEKETIKILEKLDDDWQRRKEKAMKELNGWKQFNRLCQLHDLLRAYYYTVENIFIENDEVVQPFLNYSWKNTPQLFWEEKLLPLAKKKMQAIKVIIEEEKMQDYWRSSNEATIREDQLFLQTAVAVGLSIGQSEQEIDQIGTEFAALINKLAVASKKEKENQLASYIAELKEALKVFMEDFHYIDTIGHETITHLRQNKDQERSDILQTISSKGSQLYSQLVGMPEKEVKSVLEELLQYLKSQQEDIREKSNSEQLEQLDKIASIGTTLKKIKINNQPINIWDDIFKSLFTLYSKEKKVIVKKFITRFPEPYAATKEEKKEDLGFVIVALLSKHLGNQKKDIASIYKKIIDSQLTYASPNEFPDTTATLTPTSSEESLKEEKEESLSSPHHSPKQSSIEEDIDDNTPLLKIKTPILQIPKEKKPESSLIIPQKEGDGIEKNVYFSSKQEKKGEKPIAQRKVIPNDLPQKKVVLTNHHAPQKESNPKNGYDPTHSLWLSSTLMTLGVVGWACTRYYKKQKKAKNSQ